MAASVSRSRVFRGSIGRRLGVVVRGAAVILLGLAAPVAQAQRGAPVANDDEVETREDQPLEIDGEDLLDNDTGRDDLVIFRVGEPSNGTATLTDDGDVLYRPNPDYNGPDPFTYSIIDERARTSTAFVVVSVEPVNDPPVARDDAAETTEDDRVDIEVLANDSDVDGDDLEIAAVGQPENGTTQIRQRRTAIRYTPDEGFSGTDTFSYRIDDGNGGEATATVTVTVEPDNTPPVARDDAAETDEDEPVEIDVLANDDDEDGNALSVTDVTEPASGTAAVGISGAVLYTPGADFNGTDAFTYTISDGEGGSASASVTVTVTPVNDAPVARDDAAETAEDEPVEIAVLANDRDADGDDLSVSAVTQPQHGAASVSASGTVVYTPAADYAGADAFAYTVSDGQGGTASGTVAVTVTPVNDAPIARDDEAETDAGAAIEVDVLANDSDPEADDLRVSRVTQPRSGASTVAPGARAVTYTPAPGFSGSDAFTYTVSDGNGASATATVRIEVRPEAAAAAEVVGAIQRGESVLVRASATGFSPTSATLAYRLGGARAFQTAAMVPDGDGAFEGEVPGAAVTIRGLDYYVTLTDGSASATVPAGTPSETPRHLRVPVASVQAPVTYREDGYRMVSVPVALEEAGPADVLADDLGPYVPTRWRLFQWSPEAEQYVEHPAPGLDLEPGASVWLAARAGAGFDVEDGLSVDASRPATLTLAPGWNQIASPFPFEVAWADVDGHDAVGPPAAWDGAEFALDQPVLEAWAGYFVENPADVPVDLVVPAREASPGARVAGPALVYGVRLGATSGEHRDTQNLLGLVDGDDARRLAEPPPIGSHVRLGVVEDDRTLAHSVRRVGAGASWDLEVTASPDLLPLTVAVAVDEEGVPPDGHALHLLDLDRRVALPAGRFRVSLTEAAPVRRFRVIVGPGDFAERAAEGLPLVPEAFGLEPPQPTPTQGPTTLVFDLPTSGPAALDVFDSLGRRIASLADGERDAGRHALVWDPPASTASGVYVVRLQAGALVATRTLVVVR